ncbi:hypothetical protein CD110_00910 [Staphylococcus casei]|uniref:TetR/AcrR family transcriptional regulator n=1 Tax=Staphylococcus TaxID=1279 RepID=UPI000CD29FF0|nr:TetR/AcrR family transcriptional regulator [Staphylococcus casei]PNZ62782.1 hypothetical protein CD110_00910 [Staphylococcus casei]WJE86351.1 TetR/AcrR family transcriptional regulator [Staphylococcus casei]
MSDNQTELDKRNILRLSNEESNRLTRECIETAFSHLLSEKAIEKITISEIAKKAGVSRSALYRNYISKEAILDAISKHFVDYAAYFMEQLINQKNADPSYYRTIFEKIQEESHPFTFVLQSRILEKNFINIRQVILQQYVDCDKKIQHLLLGWAGMFLHIIFNWYIDGMVEDVDSMADLCYSLSESILGQIETIDPNFSK